MKPLTFWQRLGMAVRDPYFLVGSFLMVMLALVAVLGPELAPHNPFQVKLLQYVDGELSRAPFLPGDLYPLGTDDLGRDQLSLLLYGARTTLVMALIAMLLRMLIGLLFGTLAGWWPGSWIDRLVMAYASYMTAVPALILAMILIMAVGIQRGQASFIVALAIVGCGEVAQMMRGHVMSIRAEQYIEAARAVGLSSPQILSRHVLPNLMGTLLALAALEMGSVLLLLGELGFVNLFIGGGRVVFSMATFESYHYFDVPDWGAMLGSTWRWFRSYPWLPLTPAMAFLVAILGCNLFGYGLQRFIEKGRFHPSGWSVLRFFAVVALLFVGARALVLDTGVEAQFAKMAADYDAERAMDDVAQLMEPEVAGQPALTADYVAAQFAAAGLSPTTPQGSYLQPFTSVRGRITGVPELQVVAADGSVVLDLSSGLSFDPYQAYVAEGSIEAPLVVAGNSSTPPNGAIVLALDPNERYQSGFNSSPAFAAILRVVPDDELATRDRAPIFDTTSFSNRERLPPFPNLLIGESAARQLLAQAGLDLADLLRRWGKGEELLVPAELTLRLTGGLIYEETPGANVVGYIAGIDRESQGERILVTADFGLVPQGADENASGVATLIEMARTLQAMEFVPKRTIVFAALDEGGGSIL